MGALVFIFVLVILPWGVVQGFCLVKGGGSYDRAPAEKNLNDARQKLLSQNHEALSGDNGWNQVAPWFQHDAKDIPALKEGEELYGYFYESSEEPGTKKYFASPKFKLDMGKFIKDFTPYAEKMQAALQAKYFFIPVPMKGEWMDPSGLIPNFIRLRSFARSLVVKAKYEIVNKNYDKALDDYLLCEKLGNSLQNQHSDLLTGVIGTALRGIAFDGFFEEVANLGENSAFWIKAVQEFQKIEPPQELFLNMMDGDYFFKSGLFHFILEHHISPWFINRDFDDSGSPPPSFSQRLLNRYEFFITKPLIARDMALYEKDYLQMREAAAPGNPRDAFSRLNLLETHIWANQIPRDHAIVLGQILPGMARVFGAVVLTGTKQEAAKLLAAILAYKADEKNYPASLQDLVPRYLASLPRDGDFRYKRKGSDFILYALNLSGKDHGGKAKHPPSLMPDEDWLFHPYPRQ